MRLATMEMEMEMETSTSPCEAAERVPRMLPLEVQNRRLQALAADLILENQQLSGKVAQLEAELEKTVRGLKASTAWTGMLL
jgi:hypothetical protein